MIKLPNLHAPSLVVDDVVEIACTDLIAKTGQAVGRADGFVVYVLGPIPGERARVKITAVKAKYAVADLVELLDRSPDRADPFCPVFGECGGCQVQHLHYGAQLRWKRGIVDHALRRIGGFSEPRVGFPVGMPVPRAYRNKMALVVTAGVDADASPEFGFYAAGTHDVVPIHGCPIVLPTLDATIAALWTAVNDPETGRAFGTARHVVARAGAASGESVVSITTGDREPRLARIADRLAEKLPNVIGIANSFEPSTENAVMGKRSASIYGEPTMREEIGGIEFRVSPASFFQINGAMVGEIFAYLGPHLRTEMRVIDLYCGAGTFALYFARFGARVVGIEENPHAVREAKANAANNGVADKTEFVGGRVEATLRSPFGRKALAHADVVFLDPPRKGSDEATLATLVRARVPHIWYLSCNPATLARDLAQICADGYELDSVQPFDMFPQTGHIEALATLHRADVAPFPFSLMEESREFKVD